jgi:hypothetical protein
VKRITEEIMRSFALVAFIAPIAVIAVAQDSPGMYVD